MTLDAKQEMQQIIARILHMNGMLTMSSGQIVIHVHEEIFQRVEINQVFRPVKVDKPA